MATVSDVPQNHTFSSQCFGILIGVGRGVYRHGGIPWAGGSHSVEFLHYNDVAKGLSNFDSVIRTIVATK